MHLNVWQAWLGRALAVAALVGLAFMVAGCGRDEREVVKIDGSSTVVPITEAVAEEFQAAHPVLVTVGVSGTGGGFKKLLQKEISIANASRTIKPSEQQQAEQLGIGFIELPVAFDGIAVVVNPANDWVDHLTVEELRRIWAPDSDVRTWADVRPAWPDAEIELFGPGTDSGTFDYFTEAIVGESGASRSDYTASEDDNVLVQGVSGERNALGYFGFAYYVENRDKLNAVPILADGAAQPVAPRVETIGNNTYRPLSRPLFIYVRADAAERPAVQQFVAFYLTEGRPLVREVGYVELPEQAYELALQRFEERKTGSVFADARPGQSVVGVLRRP